MTLNDLTFLTETNHSGSFSFQPLTSENASGQIVAFNSASHVNPDAFQVRFDGSGSLVQGVAPQSYRLIVKDLDFASTNAPTLAGLQASVDALEVNANGLTIRTNQVTSAVVDGQLQLTLVFEAERSVQTNLDLGTEALRKGLRDVAGSAAGAFNAAFPLLFPTQSDARGSVVVAVGDLNDITNPFATTIDVPDFNQLFSGIDLTATTSSSRPRSPAAPPTRLRSLCRSVDQLIDRADRARDLANIRIVLDEQAAKRLADFRKWQLTIGLRRTGEHTCASRGIDGSAQ